MTWMPTVTGLPVDLVHPKAHEVDFAEIAHALSHINRSAGNSREPVSVGLHTLIGLDFCPTASLRAKWLLHDAHEARLGDATSPFKAALTAVAIELYGPEVADQLAVVRHELEARHDGAIYAAAHLPFPDALEAQALKHADLRALATERRDFYTRGPAPRPWAIDDPALGIRPGPKVWRFLPPIEVEERLLACFRTHLPALQRGRRAS
ncbi:hypothetical protein [Methylobacterium sp. CCH5-D2]|uniref:hypothetical protein n=1 Tax=Methylobacterium sp. CCH5-D2 TaxID=1768765 RepID=UPI00082A40E6|nr:hypothetical protein [Methylobacterium sp. CCH5-D2]